MTQQDLARRLGVPTANLSQLEHSTSRWQSRLLWALAEELQLPQIELAMAAGVITDLPHLEGVDAEQSGFDDLILAYLSGSGEAGSEAGDQKLSKLLEDLTADDAAFLAAIARQLIVRRQAPKPHVSAEETTFAERR